MTKQRMSQKPDPATQPGEVKVLYDVTDCTLPILLVVHGQPCGSRDNFTIRSYEDAEITIPLPAGCTGGIIEDTSGQSMDFAVSIQP